MDNFYFDFKRCDEFFTRINKGFDFSDWENSKVYLVGESCPDNYNDCVTDGVLNESLIKDSKSTILKLSFTGTNPYASLTIAEDTSISIAENTSIPVKGLFITDKNNHVIFYSINTYSVYMTVSVVFKKDTMIWSDSEVSRNGIV